MTHESANPTADVAVLYDQLPHPLRGTLCSTQLAITMSFQYEGVVFCRRNAIGGTAGPVRHAPLSLWRISIALKGSIATVRMTLSIASRTLPRQSPVPFP